MAKKHKPKPKSKAKSKKAKPASPAAVVDELLQNHAVEETGDVDARVRLMRKRITELTKREDRENVGVDILKIAFEQAYTEPLDIQLTKPPTSKAKSGVEVAVLHLSDIHIGKRTVTYNHLVAAERLVLLTEKVARIINIRRSHANIDDLRIYLGGDLAEGEGNIFPGQAHEIDQDIVEQCAKYGPSRVAELILSLLQVVKKITIKAVPGNHGRNGDRHAARRNNYDSWLYQILRLTVDKALATNPKRRKDISWDMPFDRPAGHEWYANDRVLGWGCMIIHGDQIKSQLGYPWYDAGRKCANWANTNKEPFDYLFMGHFHTEAGFDVGGRRVMASASTESDNSYAAEHFASAGTPKQRLCFFDKKYGLINEHPLYLSDDRRPSH